MHHSIIVTKTSNHIHNIGTKLISSSKVLAGPRRKGQPASFFHGSNTGRFIVLLTVVLSIIIVITIGAICFDTERPWNISATDRTSPGVAEPLLKTTFVKDMIAIGCDNRLARSKVGHANLETKGGKGRTHVVCWINHNNNNNNNNNHNNKHRSTN